MAVGVVARCTGADRRRGQDASSRLALRSGEIAWCQSGNTHQSLYINTPFPWDIRVDSIVNHYHPEIQPYERESTISVARA